MRVLHSSLSLVVLVALLALIYLPLPLRNYLWQCIGYVIWLEWVPMVAPAFMIWTWIGNCNLIHLALFWLSITFFPGVAVYTIITKNCALPYGNTNATASGTGNAADGDAAADADEEEGDWIDKKYPNGICGGRACADGFLRIWTLVTIIVGLFLALWSYVVYVQDACPPGERCSNLDGLVARGLISQAQLNWWNDVLPLRVSIILMMIFEGWRVRMSFPRAFLYAAGTMFGNGVGATITVPLFVYEYRQLMRANDLAWWWCRSHNTPTQQAEKQQEAKIEASVTAPKSRLTRSSAATASSAVPAPVVAPVAQSAALVPATVGEAGVMLQIAQEPVLPNGKVNMVLISSAVRFFIQQGGSSSDLALDLLAHPSPINTRRFPILTAFGLNLPWEMVLIVMHLAVTIQQTYVWLAWLTQFEKNACWITEDQFQAFLHPAAFTMAFCPFLTFLPLMLMELTLGHFFLNAWDQKKGTTLSTAAVILGAATAYYNNINVALVLGMFLGLRELRLSYGPVLIEMLNAADAKAAITDPLPAGEQSVWYSSQDPEVYCPAPSTIEASPSTVAAAVSAASAVPSAVPSAMSRRPSGAVAPIFDDPTPLHSRQPSNSGSEFELISSAASSSAPSPSSVRQRGKSRAKNLSLTKSTGIPSALSMALEDDSPAVVVSPAAASASSSSSAAAPNAYYKANKTEGPCDRFFEILWAFFLVGVRLIAIGWGMFSNDVGVMFGNIGGWFQGLYVAWQRFFGWSPLPAPLHTQATFSIWSQLIVSFVVYYRALCLCVTLALWAQNGNSNMITRWALDVGAFLVATAIIFYDANKLAVKATAPVDAEKKADDEAEPLVSEFILSHLFVSILLFILQLLAVLLATPMIDNDQQGYNYAFHNARISVNNLVYNYNMVGMNLVLIVVALLGGLIMVFGTKVPLSRSNGSRLSCGRILVIVLPIILSFALVWPAVVQPCYLQPGREFSTVTEEQLLANQVTTNGIVVERAFLNDTATSATRQPAVRAAHPKQHGCVKAKFSLPYFIPQKYRHGLFSDAIQPGLSLSPTGVKEWWSFARFSNGLFQVPNGHGGWTLSADSKADIRGMAVKVILSANSTEPMSMTPAEIEAANTDKNTQDFVSISSPYFFAKDAKHFAGLSAAFATATPVVSILEWIWPTKFSIAAFRVSLSKFMVTLSALFRLHQLNADGASQLNPLSGNYYSATPYRMGPDQAETAKQAGDALAVKYRWRPCQDEHTAPFSAKQILGLIYSQLAVFINTLVSFLLRTAVTILPEVGKGSVYYRESTTAQQQPLSYLRINMQNSLNPFDPEGLAQPGCFQLMIQDQRDACENKIEDGSKPWRGDWTVVARLDVPLQHFLDDAALQVCENLAFNPWHALAAHRPLGDINKIRKIAYLESSKTRLALNDQKPLGPVFTGDELPVVIYPSAGGASNQSGSASELFGSPALYTFAAYPAPWEGLPKMVGQVPHNETFSTFTQTMIASDLFHSIRAQVYAQPRIREEMSKLQQYENIGLGGPDEKAYENSNHLPSGRMRRPQMADEAIWTTDEFFASNFLRGLNPMKIVKVTAATPLSARLRTLDADQQKQLNVTLTGQGAFTLEALAAQGRLLYADYPEIDGLLTVENRALYSPVVVFYLSASKRTLMPLLIQLENIRVCPPTLVVPVVPTTKTNATKPTATQKVADSTCVPVLPPIYFPAPWVPNLPADLNQTSAALTWMFAKMHVSQADAQVHQLISHLLETHLVMETTIIATHRALTTSHVLFKLLSQHFAGTVAINEFGRMTLVSFVDPFVDVYQAIGFVGGMEVMTRRFHSPEYIYMETVPAQMARRGFTVPPAPANSWDDADVPGFLYKDYSMPLWYLLRDYVLEVLATDPSFASTKTEAEKTLAMQNDPQIAAWFREMFDPLAGDLPLRNRADPRTSFTAFAELLAQIIFQGSAQHAAINFPQYDFLAFQPLRPLSLSRSMPANASDLTEVFMLEALVDNGGLQLLQTTYDILSTCCVNTLTLSDSHSGGLLDAATTLVPSFPDLWGALVVNLTQLEAKEVQRNADDKYDYPYLYPSRVPQSIAI